MDFAFALSAKINTKTVEDMIKKCVEEQTQRKVKHVNIDVTLSSDQMDRGSYPTCSGATVTFVQETMHGGHRADSD